MVQGSFELFNNSSIKIKGKSFDLNSFKSLNDILQKLIHKNKTKNIKALNTSDIVDTTGAGDFYAAGYIFGQLITSNLDVSLELGSMLAANAIKQIGASPTDDVANEIFKKYPQFAR